MNITRFTFSLALLSSVVAAASTHKAHAPAESASCSHDCKHESLHPTKSAKKSNTTPQSTKKVETIEITESSKAQEVPASEPITSAAPVPTMEVATAATPVTPIATLEIAENTPAPVPSKMVEVADVEMDAIPTQKVVEIIAPKVTTIDDIINDATNDFKLSDAEVKQLRIQLADATHEDIAKTDIALLIADMRTDNDDVEAPKTDVIKSVATKEDTEAKEAMNTVTQVMI